MHFNTALAAAALSVASLIPAAQAAVALEAETTYAEMNVVPVKTTKINLQCKYLHGYKVESSGDVTMQLGFELKATGADFSTAADYTAFASHTSHQALADGKFAKWSALALSAFDGANYFILDDKKDVGTTAYIKTVEGGIVTGTAPTGGYDLVAASSAVARSATELTLDVVLSKSVTKTAFEKEKSYTATLECEMRVRADADDLKEQLEDVQVVFDGASATTAFASIVAAAVTMLMF